MLYSSIISIGTGKSTPPIPCDTDARVSGCRRGLAVTVCHSSAIARRKGPGFQLLIPLGMRFLRISPVVPPGGPLLYCCSSLLISYRGGSTKATSKPFSIDTSYGTIWHSFHRTALYRDPTRILTHTTKSLQTSPCGTDSPVLLSALADVIGCGWVRAGLSLPSSEDA